MNLLFSTKQTASKHKKKRVAEKNVLCFDALFVRASWRSFSHRILVEKCAGKACGAACCSCATVGDCRTVTTGSRFQCWNRLIFHMLPKRRFEAAAESTAFLFGFPRRTSTSSVVLVDGGVQSPPLSPLAKVTLRAQCAVCCWAMVVMRDGDLDCFAHDMNML